MHALSVVVEIVGNYMEEPCGTCGVQLSALVGLALDLEEEMLTC